MQDHSHNSEKNVVTIIPAEDSHVPEIVELWQEFIDFHKDIDPFCTRREDGHINFEEFVRSLIESENSHVLVALDDDSVVAYSICQVEKYPPVLRQEEYGFISDMAVKATHRRRGIGELLLTQMFDWFESRNLDRIELHVVHGNKVGYSFWTKHEFKDCRHTLYIERASHEQ
jgi:ribosomal protein S18 acetylase RimI-like enzyme